MAAPVKSLEMECSKCRVATTCPRRGSSPAAAPGRPRALCQILGGYGRLPVDRSILSAESLEASERDGPCLTLAYVPSVDPDDGRIRHDLTKIFSPPILHERETVAWNVEKMYPKSHS